MKDDYDQFTERMTSFDLTLEPEPVEHTDLSIDDVLEHYGVKGMKWGVRKDRKAPPGPADITVKAVPGKKIKAKGGQHHAPAEDAVKTAVLRQKARASSTDALSNEELQALTKRLQLEANYQKLLDGEEKRKGKSFIDRLLGKEMEAAKKGDVGPTAATINGVKKVLDFTSIEVIDL